MLPDTEVLVLELAMRGKGEIEFLSKTAQPDIAVITNVGTAHIGRLGNLQSIVKAKCEILKHLKKDGLAILFNDQKLLKTALQRWNGKTATFDLEQVSDISFSNGRTYFTLNIKKLCYEKYSVCALGNIHILNSLISILVAKYLGLEQPEIQRGLSGFKIPPGRGGLLQISKDIYLIDESYNANPDSVKAAVENLVNCWGNGYKKILVLGELAELGKYEDKLLCDLSVWLKTQGLGTVITVGKKLKPFFGAPNVKNVSNIDQCRAILKKLLLPHSVALVKGSRVAKLEKVIENLVKNKN
jgi:UDP-N-acetylmuramoyl-tripeptide--D-alanyl-D-alanine ligase